MTGRYDESITTFKKALKVSPNYLDSYIYLAANFISIGREEEAGAAVKQILKLSPKFNVESFGKRLSFLNEADVERVLSALRKAGLPEKSIS
jgi:tetratricopeptide (TPR) repeat protein